MINPAFFFAGLTPLSILNGEGGDEPQVHLSSSAGEVDLGDEAQNQG